MGSVVTDELAKIKEAKRPKSLGASTMRRRLFSDYLIRGEDAIYSTNDIINFGIMMAIVHYNRQPQQWPLHHLQERKRDNQPHGPHYLSLRRGMKD